MKLSGVAGDCGKAGFEYEAKQVIRIRQENAVSLRPGQRQRSGDFADASQIVALVRVQRRKQKVGLDCHRGEELDAVCLSLRGERHHPVVQTVRALLRREVGDVGCTNSRRLIGTSHASVVEPGLWKRICRAVDGATGASVETTPGGHGEKCKKGQCRDDPG